MFQEISILLFLLILFDHPSLHGCHDIS